MTILGAAVLDFIDGYIARAVKGETEFGKQFDTLADVISFGVAPGFLMYHISLYTYPGYRFIGFLLPLFSALRLARFNTDRRQQEIFYGLPTPAMAVFVASLPLIHLYHPGMLWMISVLQNIVPQTFLVLILCALMVIPIPMISLKFKNFGWKGNEARFILIGLSILLIALFREAGIPLAIILYVLLSVILLMVTPKKT